MLNEWGYGVKKFFVLSAALMFVSCAPIQPVRKGERIAFPTGEYSLIAKKETGTATVTGQAFMRTRGGDVKVAAGSVVFLSPVTTYSLDWYNRSYLGGVQLSEPDPRLHDYTSRTTADGFGRFKFKNVPAGEFFVSSSVTWEAPTGYNGMLQTHGGIVANRFWVEEGKDVEVIVTR